jgi:two-component system chemotaxis response regulator CheB
MNILVIDDSVLYRRLIAGILEGFDEIESVITAPNGDIALKKLAQKRIELVFCDVHMPGMDGVETLKAIRDAHPEIQVVMISGISSRNADITMRALQSGAIDFIRKPDSDSKEDNRRVLTSDIQAIIRLARTRIGARVPSAAPPVAPEVKREQKKVEETTYSVPSSFSVVAIGVSTGGPEALNKLIPALPAKFPVPIVLVQHMPAGFTESLANSLDRKSSIHVMEAKDGQTLSAGSVYIAPGGRHMTVRNNEGTTAIGLNDGPPENSCRPSVDVLFRSVGATYRGKGVLACILTGMGADGASGVRTLKRDGCLCITQKAESCVVYGMPRAVDEAGLSDLSLPLEKIAPEICRRLGC